MKPGGSLLCSVAVLVAPAITFAQGPPVPVPTNFCPSGTQTDGYIDWSSMPAPPSINYGSPSLPITATLPVQGVPGLIVTVAIPSLTRNQDQGTANGPAYTALGDMLTLNALNNTNGTSDTSITLTFNQPIQGVRVLGKSVGENSYTFGVNSNSSRVGTGAFASSFTGFISGNVFAAVSGPVQLRAPSAQITTVNLRFSGTTGEHGFQFVTWSDLRIESGAAADEAQKVPTDSLMQWLRADRIISGVSDNQFSGGPIPGWEDQSGNGHNASTAQGPAPFLIYDGPHCQPALAFSNNAFLSFNLPINGWTQMTVFLVAKSGTDPAAGQFGSENAAIFWNENQYWGNTYVSPFQRHATFRFGTTQVGNAPDYQRPATVGGDFTLTTAVHNEDTDSLYVDGKLAVRQHGKLAPLDGSDGAGFLGRGYNNTYFNGEISEVLIYDRVLNKTEMKAVTVYLITKYGL